MEQRFDAAVCVRLHHRDDAAVVLFGYRQRRAHLGGVVPIVVVHHHAVNDARVLKPAARAPVVVQGLRGLGHIQPQHISHRQRAQRVQRVKIPAHLQRNLAHFAPVVQRGKRGAAGVVIGNLA